MASDLELMHQVLDFLEEEPHTVPHLARRLGVDMFDANVVVAKLEQQDMVCWEYDIVHWEPSAYCMLTHAAKVYWTV